MATAAMERRRRTTAYGATEDQPLTEEILRYAMGKSGFEGTRVRYGDAVKIASALGSVYDLSEFRPVDSNDMRRIVSHFNRLRIAPQPSVRKLEELSSDTGIPSVDEVMRNMARNLSIEKPKVNPVSLL
jgi:hypothetical protein